MIPDDMATPALSVVLPVYNEARVLEENLERISACLEDLGRPFEIVCVDDGSSDDSLAILRRLAETDERLRVDALPENRGKGAAVRAGVLRSTGSQVVFMDADLSTPLEELPRFLGALDSGYEVVIGNRRAPGSQITHRQSRIREVLGKGFTILTRLLLAPGVHDFTCGFKAFTADAAREIFRRSRQDRWAFDAEVVVIAQELGFKLVQVPVSWHHEEGSKVRVIGAVASSFLELLQIAWHRLRGRYR